MLTNRRSKEIAAAGRHFYVTAREIDPSQQTPTLVCRYILPIGQQKKMGIADMPAPPIFM